MQVICRRNEVCAVCVVSWCNISNWALVHNPCPMPVARQSAIETRPPEDDPYIPENHKNYLTDNMSLWPKVEYTGTYLLTLLSAQVFTHNSTSCHEKNFPIRFAYNPRFVHILRGLLAWVDISLQETGFSITCPNCHTAT